MPTIEISREQMAYIEALREELEDEVPYGQVRNLDAVQYLIDHHREDGDLDVEIDGDLDAEPDPEPEEAADGGTPGAVETDDAGADSGPAPDAGGSSPDPTADAGQVDDDGSSASPPTPDPNAVAAAGGGESGGGDGGSDANTTRVSGGPDPSALSGSGGDDTLNEMMQLLETHEEKWEEASSGDAKYTVELPGGDTEPAGTKDDVRALLFKHYR